MGQHSLASFNYRMSAVWKLQFALVGMVLVACAEPIQNRKTVKAADIASELSLADTIYSTSNNPIIHQSFFRHESDVYQYRPNFEPNPISFDLSNRPVMLTTDGKLQILNKNSEWLRINLIDQVRESLSSQGIVWSGEFVWNHQAQNKVVFDADGHAYALLNCSKPGSLVKDGRDFSSGLLLYSQDGGLHWTAYPLRLDEPHPAAFTYGKGARLEFQDGHNRIQGPPPILIFGKGSYLVDPRTNRGRQGNVVDKAHTTAHLLLPEKLENGRLNVDIRNAVRIEQNGLFADLHSGAGNTMLSVGEKIYLVYAAFNNRTAVRNGRRINVEPCTIGTPNYLVVFNRTTQTLSERRLLGCAGKFDSAVDPAPNVHNQPAIKIDSRGFLHVVLGAHHDNFLYLKSVRPHDVTEWNRPEIVGEAKRGPAPNYAKLSRNARAGSYTYVGLICDLNDRIHIVARWAGIGYNFRLVHLSRPASSLSNRSWDRYSDRYAQTHYPSLNSGEFRRQDSYVHQTLVVPFTSGYVVYHHKLSIDRKGNLLLSYRTMEQQFTGYAARVYCRKFPGACDGSSLAPDAGQDGCDSSNSVCRYHKSTRPQSPTLLMSTDGGKNWRLEQGDALSRGID
jgi:hypothetical protein